LTQTFLPQKISFLTIADKLSDQNVKNEIWIRNKV